jgi:RNA polymerase sigma factor (sigma-70 family)
MKRTEPSQENIQAAVNGDTAAISSLITACQPDLLKFARQTCATPEDAEDAVQETLWVISRKIGTLRTLSAFTTWAIRIVKHECFRLLKITRGESLLDAKEELLALEEDTGQLNVLKQDIVTSLATLPPIYREVLILRDIEERTAPEVADLLGISNQAVKSRLHRARSMLRLQLQHWTDLV